MSLLVMTDFIRISSKCETHLYFNREEAFGIEWQFLVPVKAGAVNNEKLKHQEECEEQDGCDMQEVIVGFIFITFEWLNNVTCGQL